MNRFAYWLYTSKLWIRLLALTGRVPAGFFLGWRRWMTLGDAQRCVGPGWSGLVAEGFNRCLKYGLRIHQIKEKFGGLRFYADTDMSDLEAASYEICEECGSPGEARADGWVKTLCDKCAEPEERYRRRERSWQ